MSQDDTVPRGPIEAMERGTIENIKCTIKCVIKNKHGSTISP